MSDEQNPDWWEDEATTRRPGPIAPIQPPRPENDDATVVRGSATVARPGGRSGESSALSRADLDALLTPDADPVPPKTPAVRAPRVAAASATPPSDRDGGSRRSGGRANPLVVLSVLLPLLTVGALFLVQPNDTVLTQAAPTTAALRHATVLCPTGGTNWVGVADAGAGGELTGSQSVTLAPGAVAQAVGPVVVGDEATAVGLVGTHVGDGTAVACTQPQFDQWFAGVGASAVHRSTVTLTNPDSGTAVADITAYGKDGVVVDSQDLRGISVAGKQSLTIPLDQRIPAADELALQVAVSRGRLGVQVQDTYQAIGSKQVARDWSAPQVRAAHDVRLLGLGRGRGHRTLSVLNPGEGDLRISFQLITDESEFAPTELADVTLRPGEVRTVDVSQVILDPGTSKVRGVRVSATGDVVAGLMSVVGADLVKAVPTVPLTAPAGLPVPAGAKELLIAGASGAGEVRVTTRAADGTALGERTVPVMPGRSVAHVLSQDVRWVGIDPAGTGVGAVVTLGADGGGVLAVWPLVTEDLVPSVRQGLSGVQSP